MGPERRRDQDGREEAVVSLEPLDLSGDAGDAAVEFSEASRHWWGDLVRPDVLAVASAGLVVVSVLGLPFAQFMANLYFLPMQVSSAWTFVPILVAAGIATALGLAAVRQGFRYHAATWVRVIGGADTLLAVLLLIGTAVMWLYVEDSGLIEDLRGFY